MYVWMDGLQMRGQTPLATTNGRISIPLTNQGVLAPRMVRMLKIGSDIRDVHHPVDVNDIDPMKMTLRYVTKYWR